MRDAASGGRLFRVPDPLKIDAISNKVSVAPGLDVRTEGGQIVVAPSLHVSGQRYAWTHKLPPADLPHWLYALMVPAPQPVHSIYKRDLTRPPNVHNYCWKAVTSPSQASLEAP